MAREAERGGDGETLKKRLSETDRGREKTPDTVSYTRPVIKLCIMLI